MEIQEDRRKVPWSDKETIILLEIWGDPQVKHNVTIHALPKKSFGNVHKFPDNLTLLLLHSVLLHFTTFTRNSTFPSGPAVP